MQASLFPVCHNLPPPPKPWQSGNPGAERSSVADVSKLKLASKGQNQRRKKKGGGGRGRSRSRRKEEGEEGERMMPKN